MRIVPFPPSGDASPDEAWHAELEAALKGDGAGPVAESWCELREDVRALAPPMSVEFERQLRARIIERGAHRRTEEAPAPDSARWLRRGHRLRAASLIATAAAVLAAVAIAGPWRSATPAQHGTARSAPASVGSAGAIPAKADELGPATGAATAGPATLRQGDASSAPARVQQLAASISLAPTPGEVQETAGRVARLAVSIGGFVQSSHVQVQRGGASEANIMLRLPSAKLSAALSSLGALAPVRAESQSLQDITDAYDAARQRLADALAERQALLRALSAATTQGRIDSLREQLSQSRGAIAQARSGLQSISQRAGTAEVEVTVLGDAQSGQEGLTLHRGLHDAGRVLLVTLVVLLIAAAILVPLALLLPLLIMGRRAWRRYQRERTLDVP
jgi:Domain of unknown function (DUF4349)